MIFVSRAVLRRIFKRHETTSGPNSLFYSRAIFESTKCFCTINSNFGGEDFRKNTRRRNSNERINYDGSSSSVLLKAAALATLFSGSLFAVAKSYFDDDTKFSNYFRQYNKLFVVQASAAAKKKKDAAPSKPSLTARELRFLNFASVEFEGQIFMTPRDFLDSVTQVQPKARPNRRELNEDEVKTMLKQTPRFERGSKQLFRQLNNDGLISYTEYLFLLCVLTKPKSGFRIAFNMFDTDGNQKVDKKEFLVIQALILVLRAGGKIVEFDSYLDSVPPSKMLQLVSSTTLQLRQACKKQLETGACDHGLETVFASSRREKRELQLRKYEQEQGDADEGEENGHKVAAASVEGKVEKEQEGHKHPHDSVWEKTEHALDTMRVQDTTLLVHFFGRRGKKTLSFDDFYKFMEHLQTEVLEVEFAEFSKGKPTITESEFATILLRYTVSRPEVYKLYMDRVKEKIPDSKGITFEQFRQFCMFLTFLDDFTIAVKLYTFTDLPVSQTEFSRAVKVSTGQTLDPYVIDTVFQIFDVNDDGRLSYSEFIAVMRDRLYRGFRGHKVERQGWDAYKHCIRAEVKRY